MSARNLQRAFEAIGTHWVLDMYAVAENTDVEGLYVAIDTTIEVFSKRYSRFIEDSLVMYIAEHPGTHTLPEDARPLMDMYKKLYVLTDGAVTPLIGTLLEQVGYDATYSLRPSYTIHAVPSWETIFSADDNLKLTTTNRTVLDFGAAGKGYLVDIIASVLQDFGVTHYCVDAGSDMRYRRGDQALTVGLENPFDTTEVIGTVQLVNRSLCASAGNRRAWGAYHHIMHPQTLRPAEHVVATWTLAPTTLEADGLATALFFVDPAVLRASFTFDYCVLFRDGTVTHSESFPGEIFCEKSPVSV